MRTLLPFLTAGLLLAAEAAPALSPPPPAGAVVRPQAEELAWLTSLDAAMERAKATGHPILMVFEGTDWCKPCILLKKEVFETPEFAAFAKDRLVPMLVAFPRQKKNLLSAEQQKANDAVAARFNREGEFPMVLVISPEGKVLATSTGYRSGGPAPYIAHLQEMVPALK